MKQVLIKKGRAFSTEISDITVGSGNILIEVNHSCVSVGTELRGVTESGKSLIRKAMDKPEKVGQLLSMVQSHGFQYAFNKLNEKNHDQQPIGYSVSGLVLEVGEGVKNFSVGDRVTAAGAKYAFHASKVSVPSNLVVHLSKRVSFSHGSTVAIGSIALHSIRRSKLQIGEFCVVYGTGVLGLIAIQILSQSGIRVAAVDINESKLKKAKSFGAEMIVNAKNEQLFESILQWTGGFGADAVLLAVGSQSSEPISNSFKMCKRKGKVILLGATGLDIQRNDIYEKELDLITSTSYGPGRYDEKYEEMGLDYPYDYVRWTENRNMAEYLRMLDTGTVNISNLITKKYDIDEVEDAFDFISNPDNNSLLVVLSYDKEKTSILPLKYPKTFSNKLDKEKIGVGIVGVSSFLKDVHLPNLLKLKSKFEIKGIYNRTGYKSEILSSRYNTFSTSDIDKIIGEPSIDLVFITTAHGDHADNVIKGLKAGKHVFVEKPLATSFEELELIKNEIETHSSQMLMVGYNRRFSPFIKEIKNHCKERMNPMIIQYRMNAGYKHSDSSAHGFGGRIIGECCHIVDLCSFLVGSDVVSIYSENITPSNDYYLSSDNKLITIKYSDGSVAIIQYFSMGSNNLSKEYMEVHFDGKSIKMDDYKSIKGYGLSINDKNEKLSNKGHYEELIEVYKSLKTGKPPISVDSLIETSAVSIQLGHM